MIVVESALPEVLEEYHPLEMLGVSLVSITVKSHNVFFRKGIRASLLDKLISLYKKQILEKKEGKIIDLLGSFTIYIHFYKVKRELIAIFYLNEKDKLIKYDSLCSLSNILLRCYCSNVSDLELERICNKIIPCIKGISALFIIYNTGHALYAKVNENKRFLAENYIQVSGFISAILSFSKEVIGQDSGESLQAINFENERFYVYLRGDIIFAYLIDTKNRNKNLKRYIELIADEFMDQFEKQIKNFEGEVTPFSKFDKIIDSYLEI